MESAEVSSAATVARQFSAREHAVREAREKTALRIIALSYFALAAYDDGVETETDQRGGRSQGPGREGDGRLDGVVGDGRGDQSPECQELVFIGAHLHPDALHAALADCLMADRESPPPTDPFPTWDTYGIDDACEDEHPGLVAAGP